MRLTLVKFNIAYRFCNGTLMGFTGQGLDQAGAEADAAKQVRRKAIDFNEEFFPERVVATARLTPTELRQVQRDWQEGWRH